MKTHNGGKRDCAMMWFTSDWRGSLKVQSMGWAEQGMYRHLLDLAWENCGIPADLDEIRGILKLSEKEFAAAWKKIGRCFAPHPEDATRLVNERQEREREIRQDVRRKRAEAGVSGQAIRQQNDSKRSANGQQEVGKRTSFAERTSSKPPPFAAQSASKSTAKVRQVDGKPPANAEQKVSLSQSHSLVPKPLPSFLPSGATVPQHPPGPEKEGRKEAIDDLVESLSQSRRGGA